jgi:hypothetical protein
MVGLKSFQTADIVTRSNELAKRIKRRQFKTTELGGLRVMPHEMWQPALAA